jgi:hypothetical protein
VQPILAGIGVPLHIEHDTRRLLFDASRSLVDQQLERVNRAAIRARETRCGLTPDLEDEQLTIARLADREGAELHVLHNAPHEGTDLAELTRYVSDRGPARLLVHFGTRGYGVAVVASAASPATTVAIAATTVAIAATTVAIAAATVAIAAATVAIAAATVAIAAATVPASPIAAASLAPSTLTAPTLTRAAIPITRIARRALSADQLLRQGHDYGSSTEPVDLARLHLFQDQIGFFDPVELARLGNGLVAVVGDEFLGLLGGVVGH